MYMNIRVEIEFYQILKSCKKLNANASIIHDKLLFVTTLNTC